MLNPNEAIALVGFAAWGAVIIAAVVCFILGYIESRPVRNTRRRRSARRARRFSSAY